jgi:hypothetical protein
LRIGLKIWAMWEENQLHENGNLFHEPKAAYLFGRSTSGGPRFVVQDDIQQ